MNEELNDSDFYLDDGDDEREEPDYYLCNSCGYNCVRRPEWGGECPKCTAIMEEQYY